MTIVLLIFALVLTLAWAAFCAGTETAFLSVSRERVLYLAREGSETARIVQAALADMSRTTTALLVGNNLAATSFSAASSAFAAQLFSGNPVLEAAWSVLAALTVLFASEFLPKLLCAARPLERSLALSRAFQAMTWFIAPLTSLALMLTGLFVPRAPKEDKLTAADIVRLIRDRRDGVRISDIESDLIGCIIRCRTAGESVTPESLIAALRTSD